MASKNGDQDSGTPAKGSGKAGGETEAGAKTGAGRRKSAYKLPVPEAASTSAGADQEGPAPTEGEAEEGGAEVIALPSPKAGGGTALGLFDNKLGEAVRQTFRSYVLQKVVPSGKKAGTVDVTLDLDFVKNHGRPLLSALFNSVTKAVVPEKIEMSLPVSESPAAPSGATQGGEASAASGEEPDVQVNVNLDVIRFVKGLLTKPPEEDQD